MATAPKVTGLSVGYYPADHGYAQAIWTKVTKKMAKIEHGEYVKKSGKKVAIETVKDLQIYWSFTIIAKNGKTKTENTSPSTIPKADTSARVQIPEGCTAVVFHIRPTSIEYTGKKKDGKYPKKKYWSTPSYKTSNTFKIGAVTGQPSAPTLELDETGSKLTISTSNLENGEKNVEFSVLIDNTGSWTSYKATTVVGNYASYILPVAPGHSYIARVRVQVIGKHWSEWSNNSSSVSSRPAAASSRVVTVKAVATDMVEVSWSPVPDVLHYEVQYFTSRDDIDKTAGTTTTSDSTTLRLQLERGKEYFFRVRATSGSYQSEWWPAKNEMPSIILGLKPSAPTIYSLVSNIVLGDTVRLYWTHNARDGSVQKAGIIHFRIHSLSGLVLDLYKKVPNPNYGDEIHQNDNVYLDLNTNSPMEFYDNEDCSGNVHTIISDWSTITKFEWRVATIGITNERGDWSAFKTIEINVKPILTLNYSADGSSWTNPGTVTGFPIYVKMDVEPSSVSVLGYQVTIKTADDYDYDDVFERTITVPKGTTIYSKYFNSDNLSETLEITPYDVTLVDNMDYIITAVVSTAAGFTDEAEREFSTDIASQSVRIEADVYVDESDLTAQIHPVCVDDDYDYDEHIVIEDGEEVYDTDVNTDSLVPGVSLAVLRINADGSLTELASGIPNNGGTWVPDPHPTLGGVRYRIVAMFNSTGVMDYDDTDYAPVDIPGLVLNWNERIDYRQGDENSTEFMEVVSMYDGDLLHLPYNMDVSESHNADVELVEYIGRPRAVAYYGTQRGESFTFRTEIPKEHDEIADDYTSDETLQQLRRLSTFMGPVYVRESRSGLGFSAHVEVNIDDTHATRLVGVSITATPIDDTYTHFDTFNVMERNNNTIASGG